MILGSKAHLFEIISGKRFLSSDSSLRGPLDTRKLLLSSSTALIVLSVTRGSLYQTSNISFGGNSTFLMTSNPIRIMYKVLIIPSN